MTEYIAVVPDDIAPDAEHQYLRLPHPRTGQPQLYLPSTNGMYEVVKVGGAKGRTWFIGEDKLAQGSMLVHAPIDPVFLAIPVVLSLLPTDSRSAPFQPLSDLLSTASSSSAFALRPAFSPTAEPVWTPDVARLVELKSFRRAFRACCDKKLVDAAPPSPPPEGDEPQTQPKPIAYFRPSRDAVLALLKAKVEHLADPSQYGKFDHLVRGLGREGLLGRDPADPLVEGARRKGAMEQIAQFLPPSLTPQLAKCFDFLALDTYLADRAAAAMAASMPVVTEKKGKAGAAKRKAPVQGSRGVEALKKVNTGGMAKMTSFFKPKEKK